MSLKLTTAAPRSLRFALPEVWVRFLVAIVGLALAFGAALFSTVSRESGSVWGTIALASSALLLATLVGLTTVPYLARRVVASRLREAIEQAEDDGDTARVTRLRQRRRQLRVLETTLDGQLATVAALDELERLAPVELKADI